MNKKVTDKNKDEQTGIWNKIILQNLFVHAFVIMPLLIGSIMITLNRSADCYIVSIYLRVTNTIEIIVAAIMISTIITSYLKRSTYYHLLGSISGIHLINMFINGILFFLGAGVIVDGMHNNTIECIKSDIFFGVFAIFMWCMNCMHMLWNMNNIDIDMYINQ